jgi:hypothetical protein
VTGDLPEKMKVFNLDPACLRRQGEDRIYTDSRYFTNWRSLLCRPRIWKAI